MIFNKADIVQRDLSIKRNDRTADIGWEDKYAIKEHFYPGGEAMEIYPGPQRLVNAANQYHLIVMPEESTIPFGMFPIEPSED